MKSRTRGFVIALASAAGGGLLPTAVSVQMLGEHAMAAGLAAVALMNAVIAVIHIAAPVEPERVRNADHKADAPTGQVAMTAVDLKIADPGLRAPSAQTKQPKEQLTFPVLGWYGPNPVGAEHMFEQLPDAAVKKPAKQRA